MENHCGYIDASSRFIFGKAQRHFHKSILGQPACIWWPPENTHGTHFICVFITFNITMKTLLEHIARNFPNSYVLDTNPSQLLIPLSIFISTTTLVRLHIKYHVSPLNGDMILALMDFAGNLLYFEKNAKDTVDSKRLPRGTWYWVFVPKNDEELISSA